MQEAWLRFQVSPMSLTGWKNHRPQLRPQPSRPQTFFLLDLLIDQKLLVSRAPERPDPGQSKGYLPFTNPGYLNLGPKKTSIAIHFRIINQLGILAQTTSLILQPVLENQAYAPQEAKDMLAVQTFQKIMHLNK